MLRIFCAICKQMYVCNLESTSAQVRIWCLQATSHYLGHCCPRSMSPYGVTKPHLVKWSAVDNGHTHRLFKTIMDLAIVMHYLHRCYHVVGEHISMIYAGNKTTQVSYSVYQKMNRVITEFRNPVTASYLFCGQLVCLTTVQLLGLCERFTFIRSLATFAGVSPE